MKTSLDIDDALYQAARTRAAGDNTTIRALVEEGLRRVLGIDSSSRGSRSSEEIARELADLEALASQVSALPLLDPRSADEILGYGDDGAFE